MTMLDVPEFGGLPSSLFVAAITWLESIGVR